VPAFVELPTDESETDVIKVEISNEGLVRAGAGDVVGRATERFDQAVAQIVRLGQDAVRRARAAATPPDAIDVELGLKLTAETGFVIAKSSGEANFKVTLRWSENRMSPTASE
jgi:Trypsin-co-occurring domain 1